MAPIALRRERARRGELSLAVVVLAYGALRRDRLGPAAVLR
jgi:hypothetical protein